jgi:L-threonylcarbamoyladenylate synthase
MTERTTEVTAPTDATDEVVTRAVGLLRRGGLAALPTETVYGLGANASDADAVRGIFAAKGRPADHPLIVHVADAERAERWAARLSPAAAALAAACWPGPLTLLVARAPHVLDVVTGGRSSVGIRVPAHPLTTAILTEFAAGGGHGGVAAPSANRFGHVSPTTAAHVLTDLDGRIDLVVDGGTCPVGVESTIVDCSVDPPQVLRPGGIPTEDIHELLHGRLRDASGPSRAPGMLAAHYAPRAKVLLAGSFAELEQMELMHPDAVVLGVDETMVELAHDLYARLRDADDRGVEHVVALLPEPVGLGHAVRDRLLKASAGRAG